MAVRAIPLIDAESENMPSCLKESPPRVLVTANLPSYAQIIPLTDREAVQLPHESSRDSSRPPSYIEADMAERLPTYMEAIRRKMKQAMPYATNQTPPNAARFWLSDLLAIVVLGVITIPIAVARENIKSSNPQSSDDCPEPLAYPLEISASQCTLLEPQWILASLD